MKVDNKIIVNSNNRNTCQSSNQVLLLDHHLVFVWDISFHQTNLNGARFESANVSHRRYGKAIPGKTSKPEDGRRHDNVRVNQPNSKKRQRYGHVVVILVSPTISLLDMRLNAKYH